MVQCGLYVNNTNFSLQPQIAVEIVCIWISQICDLWMFSSPILFYLCCARTCALLIAILFSKGILHRLNLKSHIQETPTLSACADNNIFTMKYRMIHTIMHFLVLFAIFFWYFLDFLYFFWHFFGTFLFYKKSWLKWQKSHVTRTFHRLCKFDVLVDLESLEPYIHTGANKNVAIQFNKGSHPSANF